MPYEEEDTCHMRRRIYTPYEEEDTWGTEEARQCPGRKKESLITLSPSLSLARARSSLSPSPPPLHPSLSSASFFLSRSLARPSRHHIHWEGHRGEKRVLPRPGRPLAMFWYFCEHKTKTWYFCARSSLRKSRGPRTA